MIAAVIALSVGMIEDEYAEGLGIVVAILLATTLAFINEYKASQEFEILNQVYDEVSSKVIRDGNVTSIPRKELVVGDIVYIEQGGEIPADGEVLEEVSLYLDQSKLTGESEPVKKYTKAKAEVESWLPSSVGRALLNYFMVAVTIIVVAVPEGLAMSVTLSLAYSMRKMAASHNLVRRMHACETIGAAFLGQILIIQFGGSVFRTVPLSFSDWITITAGTSIVLWFGELWRLMIRLKSKANLEKSRIQVS